MPTVKALQKEGLWQSTRLYANPGLFWRAKYMRSGKMELEDNKCLIL